MMAANHVVEAKKAQALREQADALLSLQAAFAELKAQLDRVLELLEPAKPASDPEAEKAKPATKK